MKLHFRLGVLLLGIALFSSPLFLASCQQIGMPSKSVPATGSTTRIEKTSDGYRLLFNGEPYFVRGVGGREHLDQLVEAGGNSIRTWGGSRTTLELLDEAHALGLTVTVGFWMQHERHGFDYSDEEAVRAQLEKARRHVQKFRHHPALLIWGIGNEAEWHPGTNPDVYKAINDIAAMIKQEDPHHPTMTVTSGLGRNNLKVKYLKDYCPDIDILGVNSYQGASSIPDGLRSSGWDKPYMLTEFGPPGTWEVQKASWGAQIEPGSSAKAEQYYSTYTGAVDLSRDLCIGSYAFLWGQKQEVTHTWFGMFLPDGKRLNAVDSMTYAWTGKWPANRCPSISNVRVKGLKMREVDGGSEYDVVVKGFDPDGDDLTYALEVLEESTDQRSGGDLERKPPSQDGAILSHDGNAFRIRAPEAPGPYRVFAYAYDGNGNAATLNIPFFVKE